MGEFIRSPRCIQVLSTYNVSHMINFTRLSLFPFCFSSARGEPGNEARTWRYLLIVGSSLSCMDMDNVVC